MLLNKYVSGTLDLQLSVSSVPPAYDEANRKLQPDIAPLPKIDNIQPELAVEGNIIITF